jgi:hypothetical protein
LPVQRGTGRVDTEIYELDSGTVLIFLGEAGLSGVMSYKKETGWRYEKQGSLGWDFFHQLVYRNHKADMLTAVELEKRGIPFPDWQEFIRRAGETAVDWESNFANEVDLRELQPHFLKKLRRWAVAHDRLYLILCEDTYESALGDGKALYLFDCFWEEEPAGRRIVELQALANEEKGRGRGFYCYQSKVITVSVDEKNKKVAAELNLGTFEHVDLRMVLKHLAAEKILRDLEELLGVDRNEQLDANLQMAVWHALDANPELENMRLLSENPAIERKYRRHNLFLLSFLWHQLSTVSGYFEWGRASGTHEFPEKSARLMPVIESVLRKHPDLVVYGNETVSKLFSATLDALGKMPELKPYLSG